MGREVRKVPANWQHPPGESSRGYKPLFEGYAKDAEDFMGMAESQGLQAAVDFFGRAPDQNDYMPDWPESERTRFRMYEITTEGTPISPAFATPEELARWLADNEASAFGRATASYEAWLRVAQGGYACSAVVRGGCVESGVEGLAQEADNG